MPIQFWWKPSNSPVSATANRVDIGLELGGDDTSITAPTPGRVILEEITGSGADSGQQEAPAARRVATFHGQFHRDASRSAPTRLSFELFQPANVTTQPHEGKVSGFDPECMLGVDCFVVSFVNRQFQICLPFLVDSHREGRFLEFRARAEIDSGGSAQALGQPSAVLNLRIRRRHEVETTSASPSGTGGNMRYTGKVVGNLILHPEDYLIQGVFRNTSGPPFPANLDAQIIPIAAIGPFQQTDHRLPFQAYASGALLIVLMDDLLEDLIPDEQFLRPQFPHQTFPQFIRTLEGQARTESATALTRLFTDAGFAGAQTVWESQATGVASTLITNFRARFRRQTAGTKRWTIRNAATPFVCPYWQFVVGLNSGLTALAHARPPNFPPQTVTHGGREYLIPYPLPIGSGDKTFDSPEAEVRTGFFQHKLTTDDSTGRSRQYAGRAELDRALAVASQKLAIVLAHEIAHNLGLMHTMRITNTGPYDESAGSPVLSVMAASIENDSFGVGMPFSSASKHLWQAAYGVTPTFDDSYLANKTWTAAEVRTVDWSARNRRLFRLHQESVMGAPLLTALLGQTPPFCGTGANVQRGTHVP